MWIAPKYSRIVTRLDSINWNKCLSTLHGLSRYRGDELLHQLAVDSRLVEQAQELVPHALHAEKGERAIAVELELVVAAILS